MGSTFLPLPGVMPIRSFLTSPFLSSARLAPLTLGLLWLARDMGSFGKERVCWDFIAAFRKDFQLQEAARFLVDSMKELRQDYKGNAPALHTESCGHFYGRNRILNDF